MAWGGWQRDGMGLVPVQGGSAHEPVQGMLLNASPGRLHSNPNTCPRRRTMLHTAPPHLRVLRAGLEAALFKYRLAHEVGGHHGGEARRHYLQQQGWGCVFSMQPEPVRDRCAPLPR